MKYYQHHLGDYMRDTAHLSMIEDGAYRRLLDAYYIKETPLPADVGAVCRLIRATSKQEREAVDVVLNEFFQRTDDGWVSPRCEAEIAKYQEKQGKAKSSAEKRWDKERAQCDGNANAMRTHSEGNAPNNHKPITPSLRSGVARGTRLPPSWEPDAEAWAMACETLRSKADACTELDKFRDYWAAQPGQKGVKADWPATWRNWIRRTAGDAESRGHSRQGPAKPTSAVERVRQACNLDDDGWPLGPDDGDLRPQVDVELRDETNGRVVAGDFRVVPR